jgi:hypothetical protein
MIASAPEAAALSNRFARSAGTNRKLGARDRSGGNSKRFGINQHPIKWNHLIG